MVQYDDLFGEASEVDADEVDGLARFLIDGEAVNRCFVSLQTLFAFTDERLLVVQREGFTQSTTDYHTVPYESVRDFTAGTPGRFESDAELRVWLDGMASPMRYKISDKVDVDAIYRELSRRVLG